MIYFVRHFVSSFIMYVARSLFIYLGNALVLDVGLSFGISLVCQFVRVLSLSLFIVCSLVCFVMYYVRSLFLYVCMVCVRSFVLAFFIYVDISLCMYFAWCLYVCSSFFISRVASFVRSFFP